MYLTSECLTCDNRMLCATQQVSLCEEQWEQQNREDQEHEMRMAEQEREERMRYEDEEANRRWMEDHEGI